MVATRKPTSKSRSADVQPMDVDAEDDVVEVNDDEDGDGDVEGEAEVDGEEEEEEGEREYEVAGIVGDELQPNGKYLYLVSWKGYGPEHNTWEPEAHVAHAEEIVSRYWDSKPKATKPMTGKRGRPSSSKVAVPPVTSSKRGGGRGGAKRSRGGGRGGRAAAAAATNDKEDSVEDFDEIYVDSMDKYEDKRDWEELVERIDTIERDQEDGLVVYLTMIGGEKVAQSAEVVNQRCPQKVIKFYEQHLKWRSN